MVERSRAGDPDALLEIVALLEPDIAELSRRMRMERSDAAQTLRTRLIGLVLQKPFKF
nr:helix-turn-helix domain-containing protein [Saccharibacillus deserti]